MGTTRNFESSDTEKGSDGQSTNIIYSLKRRSSVILKVIVLTFGLRGCKNVDDDPPPPQLQLPPSQEEELRATPSQERSAGCHSNMLSDVEIMVTEAAGEEGVSGDTVATLPAPSSTQAPGDSVSPATC